MSDHDDLIVQFSATTATDAEKARFYLEANDWNLGAALETYFESEGGAGGNPGLSDEDDDMGALSNSAFPPGPAARPNPSAPPPSRPEQKKTASTGARIATFSSIRNRDDSDSEGEGQDDKERNQEFYVGSGQEVLGPRKKKNPDEIINSVFQSARQHGAEEAEEQTPQSSRGPTAFGGAGIRLGATPDESKPIPGATTSTPGKKPQEYLVLRMWKNGFTIDNEPLRLYTDPENAEFMESVKQGRVPRELWGKLQGGEVNLQLEDHREKHYEKPKEPVRYFTGTGQMLGSPTPAVISRNPQVKSEAEIKAAEEKARATVSLDSAQPTTNLQIRLRDGSRLVQQFNQTNNVGDVRRFISTARPEYGQQGFQMIAGFPAKPLTDESQTLKDANLLNAVINVK